MRVDRELWLRNKELMYKRLMEDLHIGYLDEDILDVLLEIFRRRESYSTSSCSGRISLIDAEVPWSRKKSTVVFKKHKPLDVNEFLDILQKPVLWNLWVIVTSPIIHVVTASFREARKVLIIGREAGFKHSGIISIRKDGIILELRSGVGIIHPVKIGNNLLVDLSTVKELVNTYNEVLIAGKKKLQRLKELLVRSSEDM